MSETMWSIYFWWEAQTQCFQSSVMHLRYCIFVDCDPFCHGWWCRFGCISTELMSLLSRRALFSRIVAFWMEDNIGHCLRGMLIWLWFYSGIFDANCRSFEAAGRMDCGISPGIVPEDGDVWATMWWKEWWALIIIWFCLRGGGAERCWGVASVERECNFWANKLVR